jgi:hypothetical protein
MDSYAARLCVLRENNFLLFFRFSHFPMKIFMEIKGKYLNFSSDKLWEANEEGECTRFFYLFFVVVFSIEFLVWCWNVPYIYLIVEVKIKHKIQKKKSAEEFPREEQKKICNFYVITQKHHES